MSLAASAAGESYGETAKQIVIGNAMFGRSITGTVNLFKSRFGGIVTQQMLALPTQIKKAHENFAALFRGLNITPLLEGLHKTLKFLDQGTVGFNAWKTIFETLFNPLFGGAKSAGDLMEHFFNRVTIMTLDAQYAWIKMGGTVQLSAFGVKDFGDLLERSIKFGSGLAIAMLRTGQAVLFVADVLTRIVTLLQAAWDMSMGYGKTIGAIFGKSTYRAADKEFQTAASRLKEFIDPSTATSGILMMEGIIDGIKSSTPALVGAVGQAMDAANAEVKKKQDMHSPSRVWAGFAKNMARGSIDEFHAQTPAFARAAGAMASVQPARAAGAMASVQPAMPRSMNGGGSISNSQSISIGDIHMHGQQHGDMVTMPIGEFKRMLALCIEGMAIHKGSLIGAQP